MDHDETPLFPKEKLILLKIKTKNKSMIPHPNNA
jgi:hypothetical protein